MKFSALFVAGLCACLPVSASARETAERITVIAAHDLNAARPGEIIAVPWSDIIQRWPDALPDHLLVKSSAGLPVPCQFTNFHPDDRKTQCDEFLFQHDFAAGENSARFTIEETPEPVPPYPARVFARYVPERLDDFAWENDRVAHRMYGPGLDTPAAGKSRMTASGIDVWCKRVPYLIVDRWYLRGHDAYHKDTGEGLDLYDVGQSRGCGGTGVWKDGKLYVSRNWNTWKVLANGPLRAVFELTYEPWEAGGRSVAETKRFTVDACANLTRVESTFLFDPPDSEITVAVGVGKHEKAVTADRTANEKNGWLALWEQYAKDDQLGTGVVVSPGALTGFAEDSLNHLALASARPGEAIRYYIGAGWNRAGEFASKDDWNTYLEAFAQRLRSPVRIVKLEIE